MVCKEIYGGLTEKKEEAIDREHLKGKQLRHTRNIINTRAVRNVTWDEGYGLPKDE